MENLTLFMKRKANEPGLPLLPLLLSPQRTEHRTWLVHSSHLFLLGQSVLLLGDQPMIIYYATNPYTGKGLVWAGIYGGEDA